MQHSVTSLLEHSVSEQNEDCLQSTINIRKKLLSTAIWEDKNGLVSGRIDYISSKNLRSEFIQLRMYFHPKKLKLKEMTNNLNHDLTFYCRHNQLCVPEYRVTV